MPSPPVGPPLREPGLPDDLFCDRDEPTEADLLGLCPDLLAGPPDGEDAWLGDLSRATDGIRLLSGVRSFCSGGEVADLPSRLAGELSACCIR